MGIERGDVSPLGRVNNMVLPEAADGDSSTDVIRLHALLSSGTLHLQQLPRSLPGPLPLCISWYCPEYEGCRESIRPRDVKDKSTYSWVLFPRTALVHFLLTLVI